MRRRDREVRYQPQHSHLAPPAGHAAAGCLPHGIPDGRSDSGFGSHAEATLAGGLARRPSRRHRDGGKRLRPPTRCRPHAPSRNQRMITFVIISFLGIQLAVSLDGTARLRWRLIGCAFLAFDRRCTQWQGNLLEQWRQASAGIESMAELGGTSAVKSEINASPSALAVVE